MSMTPREMILRLLKRGKPERVPVTLFGGGMWSIKDYGSTFEELRKNADKMADMCVTEAEQDQERCRLCGLRIQQLPCVVPRQDFGVGIKYREIGAPDLTIHFVKSEEDIEKLRHRRMSIKDPVIKTVMEATRRVKEKIGKKYLVTMTCWGPFTLAARFVGEEDFHEVYL